MKSLREAARVAYLDAEELSVRALAENLRLPEPVSVRSLIRHLAPDFVRWKTERVMEAGDITGMAHWTVTEVGTWKLVAELHDHGKLYGDDYVLAFYTRFTDDEGKALAVGKTGHIDNGEDDDFVLQGHAPWLEAHWEMVKVNGFNWKLDVKSNFEWSDLSFDDAMAVLSIGALIIGAGIVLGSGACQRNEEGGLTCRKEWE